MELGKLLFFEINESGTSFVARPITRVRNVWNVSPSKTRQIGRRRGIRNVGKRR